MRKAAGDSLESSNIHRQEAFLRITPPNYDGLSTPALEALPASQALPGNVERRAGRVGNAIPPMTCRGAIAVVRPQFFPQPAKRVWL